MAQYLITSGATVDMQDKVCGVGGGMEGWRVGMEGWKSGGWGWRDGRVESGVEGWKGGMWGWRVEDVDVDVRMCVTATD